MQRPSALERAGLTLLVSAIAGFQPLHAQSALLGTVLVDGTERPLANAEIVMADLNLSARSDSAGNFEFLGVPAGQHEITIRLIGYEPLSISLLFNAVRRIERDFMLKPVITKLAPVDVNAKTTPLNFRLAEFDERRRLGFGHFITQDVFERADGRQTSDVMLSKIPGLRAVPISGGERVIASIRGAGSSSAKPSEEQRKRGARNDCYVQVFVNGVARYRAGETPELFDINSIAPNLLVGMEYYSVAETPVQFNSTGAQCGTVLIWTK